MIELLPDSIANQIAAGEVIQRPASIVKELLENAIDAEAQNIDLIITQSGKGRIQVVDDGVGMGPEDARLCFERHATSKIRTTSDLFDIQTMGFRGEALASIAAVAQVELKTRTQNQESATQITIEGSKLQKQQECAFPVGTSIAVKNLFFNVPARRKFLKSDAVELRHIQDEFRHVAMAYPEVAFSFVHNEKTVFKLPAQGLKPRIVGLLGKKWSEYLLPVEESTEMVSIKGYIAKPEKSRKRPDEQYFFVNRRYFKSGYLFHALNAAYEGLIPKDYKPAYVVFFEMDPAMLDVNVHPTKQEVKFENQRAIYNYLKVAVRHALGKFQVTPSLDFESDNRFAQREGKPNSGSQSSFPPTKDKETDSNWAEFLEGVRPSMDEERAAGEFILSSKVKPETDSEDELFAEPVISNPFQIHKSYIISPIRSGFMLIDQSLAHERILYEKYLNMLEEREVQTQRQLYPVTVEFTAADAELFEQMLPSLQSLGFDIEPFGNHTFILQGLPAMGLLDSDGEQMLLQLLDDYKSDRENQLSIDQNVSTLLAKTSCIKKGKELAPEEIEHLIAELFACDEPSYSPGGRPCFFTYTLKDLQKKFSKKQ
jgi:DNA mismatch repair protein MutL